MHARGLFAGIRWTLLAAGDLVMMHKQLMTLKALAEASAASETAVARGR